MTQVLYLQLVLMLRELKIMGCPNLTANIESAS